MAEKTANSSITQRKNHFVREN